MYPRIRPLIPFLSLLILALLCATGAAAGPAALQYVDSAWWTFNKDCSARNDTIVTTLLYGVQIWDAAGDPAQPDLIGDYYLEGNTGAAVDMSDNVLGVTDTGGRLHVIDIADPTLPVKVGELDRFGIKSDLAFQKRGGQRLCFVVGSDSLRIVDLSDPAAGTVIGSLALAGNPHDLSLFGDSLAVLADGYGFHIVDAADPANPQLVGGAELSVTGLNGIACNGEIVVVGTQSDGFLVYGLGDPTAPDYLSSYSMPTGSGEDVYAFRDVILGGDLLYLAALGESADTNERDGIQCYDLADPANPLLLGYDASAFGSIMDKIHLDGDHVFMTHWGPLRDGVHLVDVSDPGAPSSLGHTQAWDYTRFAAVEDGRVYTAIGHMGVSVHGFDETGGFNPGGGFEAMNVWGVESVAGVVHIASYSDGYIITDWPTTGDGTLIGQIDPGGCREVKVSGDRAYLAIYELGLMSVDISDPADPTIIDQSDAGNHSAVAVDVQGDLLALAERNYGMDLYAVDAGGLLTLLGGFLPAARVMDVKLNGDYAYICCVNGDLSLKTLDIRDPGDILEVHSITLEANGCWIDGDYLFVAAGGAGLIVYSLADPAAPLEICRYDTTKYALRVMVEGNIAFVSDNAGLVALRFIPDTPAALSFFTLAWDGRGVEATWELGADCDPGDLRLLARPEDGEDGEDGASDIAFAEISPRVFQAYDERAELTPGDTWRYTLEARDPGGDWHILNSAVVRLDAAAMARPSLAAYPNPFNPRTVLRFRSAEAGRGRLDIFDLNGRRVRTLLDGDYGAGLLELPWDGRDDRGRNLATGLYFACFSSPAGRTSTRLVLIR